jgi:hypothetical protein
MDAVNPSETSKCELEPHYTRRVPETVLYMVSITAVVPRMAIVRFLQSLGQLTVKTPHWKATLCVRGSGLAGGFGLVRTQTQGARDTRGLRVQVIGQLSGSYSVPTPVHCTHLHARQAQGNFISILKCFQKPNMNGFFFNSPNPSDRTRPWGCLLSL